MSKDKNKNSKPESASGKKGVKDSSSAALAETNAAEVKTAPSPKTEDKLASSTTIEDVPSLDSLGLKDERNGEEKGNKGDHHHFDKKDYHKKPFKKSSDRGDHKGFTKPAPVATTPKESNQLLPATVTDLAVVDRALTEIEAPSIQATTLLQPGSYNANLTDVIRTKITEDVSRAHTGWNPGDNAVVGNVVRFMNELCLRKNVYSFDIVKSTDVKHHMAYYTPRERQREVDIANVSVNRGASQRGTPNSGYPYSSRFGNSVVWRPYQPQIYDEIKQFPLQGFVIKPSNTFFPANGTAYANHLTQILHMAQNDLPAFLGGGRAYTLPLPGFNYIPTNADVNQGRVAGELHDYRNVVNRLKILDGPYGTCYRNDTINPITWGNLTLDAIIADINGEIPILDTITTNEYVFAQHPDLTQFTENILDCGNAIDRGIEPTDYMSYPDLNAETYLFDMHHIYMKLLHNVQDRIYTPLTAQLVGLALDEQAVWHSLIALEQMGTFFRIILHSIQVSWQNAGFVARKLGCLGYNDMVLRMMSPTRKAPLFSFLAFIGDIVKDLPYNKYVVDNFKLWFDCSMQSKSGNPYDENNTVMSLRAIFSSIYNYIGWDGHATDANTFPHVNVQETRSLGTLYNLLHPGDHNADTLHNVISNEGSRFGMWVMSNITQSAIFVPHGCPVGDFLYHFNRQLFISRAPRILERGNANMINDAANLFTRSLTMMLDPLGLTGFAINLFDNFNVINQMRAWFSSWYNLVRKFNEQIKESGVSCGSFYYDEKPQLLFDLNAYYANEAVVVPGYKQHIISYIQQSPRFAGRLDNNTQNGNNTMNFGTQGQPLDRIVSALWITGHRPIQQANNQPNPNFFQGVLQATVEGQNYMAMNHGNLPRVGFQYSSLTKPFDYGTIGDAMYNVATAWYTTNEAFYPKYHDKFDLATMAAFEDALDGGRNAFDRMLTRWYSGNFMSEPYLYLAELTTMWMDRYMVKHWWYPAIWNIPYYPRTGLASILGTELIPCYDYRPVGDLAQNDSFTPHKIMSTDYVERYSASLMDDGGIAHALPISATRVLYGAYNNDEINNAQWAHNANVSGGFNFNGLLLTRENKVSIFTVYNSTQLGILSVPQREQNALAHYEAQILSDNDGVPEWWYTLEFEKIFSLPCCTLSSVSAALDDDGGTMRYIDAYTYNLGLNSFISGSDLDLSICFANLAAVCGKLRAMVSESECYPSSDGYGHDLLSHPEDQKPYENRGASVPDYATAINSIMNGNK